MRSRPGWTTSLAPLITGAEIAALHMRVELLRGAQCDAVARGTLAGDPVARVLIAAVGLVRTTHRS